MPRPTDPMGCNEARLYTGSLTNPDPHIFVPIGRSTIYPFQTFLDGVRVKREQVIFGVNQNVRAHLHEGRIWCGQNEACSQLFFTYAVKDSELKVPFLEVVTRPGQETQEMKYRVEFTRSYKCFMMCQKHADAPYVNYEHLETTWEQIEAFAELFKATSFEDN